MRTLQCEIDKLIVMKSKAISSTKNIIIRFERNYSLSRCSIPSIYNTFDIVISENVIKLIATNSINKLKYTIKFYKKNYYKKQIPAIKMVTMMFKIKIFLSKVSCFDL